MTPRTLRGPFVMQDLGGGVWSLKSGTAAPAQVFLRLTVDDDAGLRDPGIQSLELEWRDDGVTLRITGEQGVGVYDARIALIHESRERLYDGLPLAGFDLKARQFWQRVFLLMRLPGGRFFLRLLARRKR